MRIAVGVVAHESRRAQANELADVVDAEAFSVDDGTLACDGNHLRVLAMMGKWDTEWSIVLEDDAVPVAGFRFHVKRALALAPAPIVGLYLGTGNPSGQVQRQMRAALDAAARRDRAWISADCLIGSVGYVIRTSLIEGMLGELALGLEVARRYGRVEYPLRISRWAQHWDIDIAYTVPSLVDHADALPIGYDPKQPRSIRKAWRCGTRDSWDTGMVPLGHCTGWSKPDG